MNTASVLKTIKTVGTGAVVVALAVGAALVLTPSQLSFPDATNTGTPAGVVLTNYTGPTTITSCGTVIDSKILPNGLDVRASNGTTVGADGLITPCVTIKNSLVKGQLDTSYSTSTACGSHPCGPLLVTDTSVTNNLATDANIKESNYELVNVNESGGRTGALCDGFCYIKHSFLHDNYFVGTAHMGSFLSNGNSGRPITLENDTLQCNVEAGSPGGSGGCSADVNLYGDFGTISNVIVHNSLLKASVGDFYYCAYSGGEQSSKANPQNSNVQFQGNVFEKGKSGVCGDAGPVADWQLNAGDCFQGNTFDDGSTSGLPASGGTCAGGGTGGTTTSTTTVATVTTSTTVAPTTTVKPTTTTIPKTTTTQAPVTTTVPKTTTTVAPPPPTTTTTVPLGVSILEFCAAHPGACNVRG